MARCALQSILVIHDRPADFADLLKARFPDIAFTYATAAEEVAGRLAEVRPQAVFSIKQPAIPEAAHREAADFPSVHWVHVGGSGYDHIAPWESRRLTVTNCAGVLAPYLAETTVAGILALNGRFPRYWRQQQERRWQSHAFMPLSGQTLLVVGLGHIGREVAKRAKCLGMRVLGVRRRAFEDPLLDGAHALDELPGLVGAADYVSIHLRLGEASERIFDRDLLAAMKPGAAIVNTSRGRVVDEAALIEALRSGHLGGAYLDVFETEPLPQDSPLWGMDNVIVTPHSSDYVSGWPRKFAELFAQNIELWGQGAELVNEVRPG